MNRTLFVASIVCWALAFLAMPAAALPTMIRLGYADCAACHISPQGGGPLTVYGRGIDEAQSLRAGEYKPSENDLTRLLTLRGRITQDVRAVFQEQGTWTSGPAARLFRPRLLYRNVSELGGGFRISAILTTESSHAPRPAVAYDPAIAGATSFVNTALVHYRHGTSFEVAVGRDQLPTGVNIPDLAAFIKARNRLGYYDAPTQVKVFLGGKRYHVTPFAFGPGGNEPSGERERGTGTLAEFDLLGHGRTVVGASLLHGTESSGTRRTVGAYTRLGFGRWGVLAEHDVTTRDRDLTAGSFAQQTSYAQLFWAGREWLVASLIGERLRVDVPFEQRFNAGKFELAARLTSFASITGTARVQRDALTGRLSKSLAIQASFKTVY
jgi:hypothetical protein